MLFGLVMAVVGVLLALPAHAGPSDGLPKTTTAVDRLSPRRAVQGFQEATRSGDFTRAAYYLDLRGTKAGEQTAQGPLLASHLAYVLERKLPVDLSKIPDEPEGAGPGKSVVVGNIYLEDEPVPISMTRVADGGSQRWVISRTTVSMIPALYSTYGTHGIRAYMPSLLVRLSFFGNEAWQWVGLLALMIASYLGGALASWLLSRIARRLKGDVMVTAARSPLALVTAVLLFREFDDELELSIAVEVALGHVGFTVLVIGIGWFLNRLIGGIATWAEERLPTGPDDDGRNRGVRTQLAILRRIGSIVVGFVCGSIVLIQFEFVRHVGLSLLASAGLAGVVVGLAAQKSLAGIIAGIQISVTQPVRIGDVVSVEKEVGTVEEIFLTYVVLRLFDQRRLIIPIGRFLDQPFENWTKTNPALLGVVLLPVDFAAPIDKIRAETTRLCQSHPQWDRRLCSLHVTDITDRSLVCRILASAANSDDAFDLRAALREGLMKFLSELEGGRYLAQQREQEMKRTT